MKPIDHGYPGHVEPTVHKTLAVARGAAAGAAATTVMTAALALGKRCTSSWRQPPVLIVRTLLAGRPARGIAAEEVVAAAAHLGYGTTLGAVFALLTRRGGSPGPAVGVGYALVLWLISYAGWIPGAGVMPPPHRDVPGRQITLIAGHVVYGAVLATVLRRLRDARGELDAALSVRAPSRPGGGSAPRRRPGRSQC